MKIKLIAESEIAYDSPDHQNPLGTSQDNSTNERFNRKVYEIFNSRVNQTRVLDLGCSGGGFIRSCINDGLIGVGLEGSDFSKKMARAEWATIPKSLFTCDISKKFKLLEDDKHMKFDLITSWEVLEHIEEKDLKVLMSNIKSHLKEDGLFICSISNGDSMHNGVKLHQTQRSKEWWIKEFKKNGFYNREELYPFFNNQWVRGRKETDSNFHIVVSLNNDKYHMTLPLKEKVKDFWVGSKAQILLKYLINGSVK